jgi:NADH:ubiquinone oxidoreductase subunit 6 (subunit J)
MLADTPTDPATLLPIALTAGLGMAALYVLLPRPNPYPRLLGAILGILALFAAAFLIVRVVRLNVEAVLFYAFSGMALVSGGVMITRQNAARAALSFALVILSTCGLFLLQAAPFLMAGTVIIYAGAIIVTFLFVIMLAQPEGFSDADARSREPLLAAIAGFFLLATLLLVLRQTYDTRDFDDVLARVEQARRQETFAAVRRSLDDLGNLDEAVSRRLAERVPGRPLADRALQEAVDGVIEALGGNDAARLKAGLDRLYAAVDDARRHVGRLQPPESAKLSPFAGTPANQPPQPISADNVAGLGRALFTDYLLAVELGGTLLLIATIGAIAITHRRGAARRAA